MRIPRKVSTNGRSLMMDISELDDDDSSSCGSDDDDYSLIPTRISQIRINANDPTPMLMDVSTLGHSIPEEDEDDLEVEEEDSISGSRRWLGGSQTTPTAKKQQEWNNSHNRLSFAAASLAGLDSLPSMPARRISDPHYGGGSESSLPEFVQHQECSWNNSRLSLGMATIDSQPAIPSRRISDPRHSGSESSLPDFQQPLVSNKTMAKKTSFGTDSSPIPPARRISDNTSVTSSNNNDGEAAPDSSPTPPSRRISDEVLSTTAAVLQPPPSSLDSSPSIPSRRISDNDTASTSNDNDNVCNGQNRRRRSSSSATRTTATSKDNNNNSTHNLKQQQQKQQLMSNSNNKKLVVVQHHSQQQQQQQHCHHRRPSSLTKRATSDEVPCLVNFSSVPPPRPKPSPPRATSPLGRAA